jgi:hypothetical protein
MRHRPSRDDYRVTSGFSDGWYQDLFKIEALTGSIVAEYDP